MSIVNFRKTDEIIGQIFGNSDNNEKFKQAIELNNKWEKIVGSISSSMNDKNRLGQFLAAHTRIIDLKNKILMIETDHPGYIQILQMYNSYILRGIKMKYPQLEINSIAYKLKNTDVHLHEIPEESDEQSSFSKTSENADKKAFFDENKNTEDFYIDPNLPEEIKAHMERIRDTILTKNPE
ncbi:MAG: hypothetical protein ACTTHG_04000 [Treponemataceae bacterium]